MEISKASIPSETRWLFTPLSRVNEFQKVIKEYLILKIQFFLLPLILSMSKTEQKNMPPSGIEPKTRIWLTRPVLEPSS